MGFFINRPPEQLRYKGKQAALPYLEFFTSFGEIDCFLWVTTIRPHRNLPLQGGCSHLKTLLFSGHSSAVLQHMNRTTKKFRLNRSNKKSFAFHMSRTHKPRSPSYEALYRSVSVPRKLPVSNNYYGRAFSPTDDCIRTVACDVKKQFNVSRVCRFAVFSSWWLSVARLFNGDSKKLAKGASHVLSMLYGKPLGQCEMGNVTVQVKAVRLR